MTDETWLQTNIEGEGFLISVRWRCECGLPHPKGRTDMTPARAAVMVALALQWKPVRAYALVPALSEGVIEQ